MRRAVVDGVGQRKFLRGEQPAGVMHALIFWGFVVLLLQVVTLFGRAFDAELEPARLRWVVHAGGRRRRRCS